MLFVLSITMANYGYSQLIASSNAQGNLHFIGELKVSNKLDYSTIECIANSPSIEGVESYNESEKDLNYFVKGSTTFSCSINDNSLPAGKIEYKFEYLIIGNTFFYKFYDFIHSKSNSKYNSLDVLSGDFSKKTNIVFTKKQSLEIMNEIKRNLNYTLQTISAYCLN